MATLTTRWATYASAQDSGGGFRVEAQAYYSNVSGLNAVVHARVIITNISGLVYTGANKQRRIKIGGSDTGNVSWPDAPINPGGVYTSPEITVSASSGENLHLLGYVWSYVYGGATAETTVTMPDLSVAPDTPTISAVNEDAFTNKITYGTSSFGTPSSGTVRLEASLDQSNWTLIASKTTTGSSTFTHQNLVPNTTYYYRAKAANSSKESAYTSTVTQATKAAVYVSQNGLSKAAQKAYASLGGQSKLVLKVYDSVNGTSRRIV